MFNSVSKFLKDSIDAAAAADVVSQAKNIISNSATIDHIYCHNCQGQITIVTAYGKYVANNKCRMCCHLFCTNCVTKSKIGIPDHLLNIEFRKPVVASVKGKTEIQLNEKQLLCIECTEKAKVACMEIFAKGINDKFEECFNQYFENKELQLFLFPIPTSSPADTTYRKALRLAVIAEVVADFSGYSMAYKAVKYAYYSHELVNLLMKGGISALMMPLLDSLKDYGITGPTAVLRVYYLGCKQALAYKINTLPKSALYQPGMTGVLLPECPLKILRYIGGYLSPAQWLYVSSLPAPHNSNDWSSWYLSRIIRKQGWTVVMCINETTQLPNGVKCPAFALVTRRRKVVTPSAGGNGDSKSSGDGKDGSEVSYVKEAMLVIRGSKSTMDWAINLEESLTDFEYTYKAHCQSVESPGLNNVLSVHGKVHKGIHSGAMGILDAFNVRHYLLRLLTKGYKITVVGHSLGAGTAVLIAADMRSTVSLKGVELHHRKAKQQSQSGGSLDSSMSGSGSGDSLSSSITDCPFSKIDTSDINYHLAHNISAVVFASPAIITEPLADAFSIDKLLINVVAGNDIIPRVTRKSFAQLAREVDDFTETANLWTQADKADFWAYMENMGKASDIVRNTESKSGDKGEKAVEEADGKEGTTAVKESGANGKTEKSREEKSSAAASEKKDTDRTNASMALLDSAMSGFLKYTSKSTSTNAAIAATNNSSSSSSASASEPPQPGAELSGSGFTTSQVTQSAQPSAPPAEDPNVPSAPPAVVVKGVPAKPAKPDKPRPAGTVLTATAVNSGSSSNSGVVSPIVTEGLKDSEGSQVVPVVGKLQIDDPTEYIVTPSPIVHLYRENNGQIKSAVVTHTHAAFTRIDLILEEVMEDHKMTSYRSMLTSAAYTLSKSQKKRKHGESNRESENGNATSTPGSISASSSDSDRQAKEQSSAELSAVLTAHIFNTACVEAAQSESNGLFSFDGLGCKCTIDQEFVERQSVANADYIEGVDAMAAVATEIHTTLTAAESDAQLKSAMRYEDTKVVAATSSNNSQVLAAVSVDHSGSTAVTAERHAEILRTNGEGTAYTTKWKPCYLCSLDVTWPYMLHSDAGRATVTHNCSACGEVVCSACAPAGDQLPGDGYNQYYTLPDFRIALPSQGLFSPTRVCLSCYFDSSHATHEA